MANKEQLKILNQGAYKWNRWRKEHLNGKIDLSKANLSKANLSGANLCMANLIDANLHMANLSEADLSGANLSKAILFEAILDRTNLSGANLNKADLSEANLSEADLSWAKFRGADLSWADLSEADLSGADLSWASLIQTDLSDSTTTGIKLYGTARDDWKIDGIECDYVYWDLNGKELTPKDRIFRPGEFEELYKQLPTFEYYFEHGFTPIDAVVMDRVVQAINERHPEFELKLDSFHSRGQPHATFTVLHKEVAEEALKQITADYEARIKVLEGKREQLLEAFTMLSNKPQYAITVGELIMGDKKIAGRDYFEHVDHSQVTTGDTFSDQAQKLIQATTPQSSQDEILNVLSFIQEELPKLPLPEEVKEEVANEVKGAEIQAKKEKPEKPKLVDRLKNAQAALTGMANVGKEAVMVGNLLVKAIEWAEQWLT